MNTTPSFDLLGALDELGDPDTWDNPTGYPNSLALCVIDAIWSMGIRYQTVEKVLDRYISLRSPESPRSGSQLNDTPQDFLDWYASMPDAVSAARRLGSTNRTSSTNGILKVEAVATACGMLVDERISTPSQLLTHSERIQPRWMQEVKGQRSGISWRYLLMLAGSDGVKPDRMITRFMRRFGAAPGLTPDQFVSEITSAIRTPVTAKMVDHRIWTIERINESDPLADIGERIEQFANERDWDKFHTVTHLFVALTGEIGEAAELIQWKSDQAIADFVATPDGRRRFGEELADIFIYLIRMAQKAGIDIVDAVDAKLDLNARKYPVEASKGDATKHSERDSR